MSVLLVAEHDNSNLKVFTLKKKPDNGLFFLEQS